MEPTRAMIQAVTFDVTHTLIHSPRLGEIYAEVLGRHGLAVTPVEAARLVRVVWQELACLAEPGRDRFTAHEDGARGWWRHFVHRLGEYLGGPPVSPFAAAELFHRFGRPEAWEVYPDVAPALAALRDRGLRLGVVSNWDDRLPGLLAGLGLAPSFEALVHSSGVGVEKPDRRIFRAALDQLGVAAGEAVHVGDGRLEDVEGALAAGMYAVQVSRRGGPGLAGLAGLPALLEDNHGKRAWQR
jgi:putative hydrolase of the HAD superfamily